MEMQARAETKGLLNKDEGGTGPFQTSVVAFSV